MEFPVRKCYTGRTASRPAQAATGPCASDEQGAVEHAPAQKAQAAEPAEQVRQERCAHKSATGGVQSAAAAAAIWQCFNSWAL